MESIFTYKIKPALHISHSQCQQTNKQTSKQMRTAVLLSLVQLLLLLLLLLCDV